MNKKIAHSVFENIASEYPDNIAVEFNNNHITYKSLNENANIIGLILNSIGVETENVVAVYMPSCIDYVTTIIGVSKCAGVFMPLDIDSPGKRLQNYIDLTMPKCVITNREHKDGFLKKCYSTGINNVIDYLVEYNTDGLINLIHIDKSVKPTEDECPVPDKKHYPAINTLAGILKNIQSGTDFSVEQVSELKENLPLISNPDDGSYIMFSSGSTGEPKVILGRTKSLSHFIHWEMKEFSLDNKTRISQLAPTTFDVSLRDIFVPLLSGGTVCIPDKET